MRTSHENENGKVASIMTVKELCAYLKICPATAYRLISKHQDFPMFKTGNRLRFRRVALAEWMDKQVKREQRARHKLLE